MSDVKRMNLGAAPKSDTEQLEELKDQLVDVLEKINKIRPVQFLDWESEFIYNFIGLMDRPEDDRVFICVSAEYDNLRLMWSPHCRGPADVRPSPSK